MAASSPPEPEIPMNRKILYAAVAFALASAGVAAAQQPAAGAAPAPRPDGQHARLDANGDGVIDRSEAETFPRFAARFDELDKNKDGKLAADERPQRQGGHHGRHGDGGQMMKADTDQDGRISKAEAAADPRLAERFAQMDADKDGYVDSKDREQRRREHRETWFASADANKDGKLSQAEMEASGAKRGAEFQQKRQAHSAERFKQMDKNGDGSISREEMVAAPTPRR
jgi:hypothetical protein